MDESHERALKDFVEKATSAYGRRIKSIILFGSVARGTDRPDSDIDLLVVIDQEDFQLRRDLIGMTFDILLDTGQDISVKVISVEDFLVHQKFSFIQEVLSEGIKIA